MNYISFETGNNVYKLRLNTRNIILLEKKLGGNPLLSFTKYLANEELPPMEMMIDIFHASLLAYQSDMTIEKAYDIFDEWLDEGHMVAEFIGIIIEIYQHSGLIQKELAEKN